MKTLTKHYIDGAFVESHGREVMDIISPTNRKLGGRASRGAMRKTSQLADVTALRTLLSALRPDDEGRARGVLAPAARGRVGASR